MQVYTRELLDDDVEQIFLSYPGNLVAELEPLEDVKVVRLHSFSDRVSV